MDRFTEIEERLSAIKTELETEGADLDALEAETRSLVEEKKNILAEEAKKQEARDAIAAGEASVKTVEKMEERTMEKITVASPEYRDAFYAMIRNEATEEQRGILADNSAYGDGVSLPVGLDTAIWNQVATAHPILADVVRLNSGMAIKVTKMTPAAISKKKDSDANSEETYTTAEVTLVGADYHTYIRLSYAEARMSQGAMETYLANDIATIIGEAVAKDVFARILSDAGTTQKVTATTDMFADVKNALALAKTAGVPVIYAPSAKYYEIVGAMNTAGGNPFNIGTTLGCEVKLDNAATGVVVVDPKQFILNVVQDVMVETGRNIPEAKLEIGGYMRAEGCLRKTTAAAYIA